jgi:hypothetical protein
MTRSFGRTIVLVGFPDRNRGLDRSLRISGDVLGAGERAPGVVQVKASPSAVPAALSTETCFLLGRREAPQPSRELDRRSTLDLQVGASSTGSR